MPMPMPTIAALLWSRERHEMILVDEIPPVTGTSRSKYFTRTEYSREHGYTEGDVKWDGKWYCIVAKRNLDNWGMPPRFYTDPAERACREAVQAEQMEIWNTEWPSIVSRYARERLIYGCVIRFRSEKDYGHLAYVAFSKPDEEEDATA